MKVLFHIDADAFFVSASQTLRPETIGKPVVVSGKRGSSVIGAASYEARAKGIGAAMLLRDAIAKCPDLIFLPGDFELYEKLSKRMFEIFRIKYTELIEIASIDECYMDVSNIWKKYGSAFNLAKDMQRTIKKELGITISIGISYTKWLAKMCSNIRKPNGVTSLGPKNFKETIWKMDIEKYFGIGKKTWPLLKLNNIHTIGDIAKLNPDSEIANEIFKNKSKALIDTVFGISSDVVNNSRIKYKEISNSRTFSEGYSNDRHHITEVLRGLTEKVASTAIEERKIGLVVGITLKDTNFNVKQKQIKLRIPVQSAEDIFPIALNLFDKNWKGNDLRLIGVKISQTRNIDNWTYQQSFFDKKRLSKIKPLL
ncbi:DNA polymerase IV [Mycoplasma marinum]|uniref:DNA polymerase IV n=1 Tax=Mycoplasma marinum TaxID=1937190 RepID=A0A4R0XSU6_9MOLU|nr:DNA polymerase IV [Mycoplasma marinum]TCG10797.1 DNA polymerase IV [Mycoplasma marinum]